MTEITNMNDELYKYVGRLRDRIEALEEDNKNLRYHVNTQEQLAANTGFADTGRNPHQQGLGYNDNIGTSTLSLLVPHQGSLPTPMSPAAGVSSFSTCVTDVLLIQTSDELARTAAERRSGYQWQSAYIYDA
jgi:hypothetical protein